MIKKMLTFFTGVAFLCLVGGVVYADANGVFLRDNEAAMQLVDKYMSFVMRHYTPGEDDISFKGIIKQGCDFWYYNDYNNKTIALNHQPGSELEVTNTEYVIQYNSLEYNDKIYTINATITEWVHYKNYLEPACVVRNHTILIEQKGSEMYIIDDVMDPRTDLSSLMPKQDSRINQIETLDTPNTK